MKILVINCGSTSTKIALYDGAEEVCSHTDRLPARLAQDLRGDLENNLEYRSGTIERFLSENSVNKGEISGVAARGGAFYPVHGGAYVLDENLVQALTETMPDNPDNCSGVLGYRIAQELGVPAFIYDAVTVDELKPIARYSGAKDFPRYSRTHTLNTRAMAIEAALEAGQNYKDLNIITAHLGGGVSVNVFEHGRLSDLVTSEEGGFSAERCGALQGDTVIDIVKEKGLDFLDGLYHGKGGLVSYYDTNDAEMIENEIGREDPEAAQVIQAMAYQVAKSICSMAAAVSGNVDMIVLTGGMLHSETIAEGIRERVKFLAPVKIKPGEKEMYALAQGAIRVIKNEEEARRFPPGAKGDA